MAKYTEVKVGQVWSCSRSKVSGGRVEIVGVSRSGRKFQVRNIRTGNLLMDRTAAFMRRLVRGAPAPAVKAAPHSTQDREQCQDCARDLTEGEIELCTDGDEISPLCDRCRGGVEAKTDRERAIEALRFRAGIPGPQVGPAHPDYALQRDADLNLARRLEEGQDL